MVSPGEWGPNAWELLHGIAERVGSARHESVMRDQRNELKLTLRHFWALLPCHKCQAHYREWLLKNPPEEWINTPFPIDLQDKLRDWLFRLHSSVNERNGITIDITLGMVQDKYKSVNLQTCFTILKSIFQRGVQARVLKPEEWKVASKHLSMLLLTL